MHNIWSWSSCKTSLCCITTKFKWMCLLGLRNGCRSLEGRKDILAHHTMVDSNIYHCFHEWKRGQNHANEWSSKFNGSNHILTISKRLILFVCFLIAILLLAICFKYYCSATSENLLGHKIDLSIFSHFSGIGPWLDLLYCANSKWPAWGIISVIFLATVAFSCHATR